MPGDAIDSAIDDAIDDALDLLEQAARQELARHPRAHLLTRLDGALELSVELSLQRSSGDRRAEAVRGRLRQAIEVRLAELAARSPGRVVDLRTGDSDGPGCVPPDGRSVFAGYTVNGAPRFVDFGQWLLDQGHPEQDKLYRQPPWLVTVVCSRRDLMSEVLPALRPEASPVRLRGQVMAGWFRVPQADGVPGSIALTLQILSTGSAAAKKAGKESFSLDLIGVGPGGESLDEVVARLETPPWRPATLWGQQALESFGRGGRQKNAEVEQRLLGVLAGIARRLHQVQRGRQRRTGHAEVRHKEGGRPTRMAFSDLQQASDDRILFDRRRETVIVLGERGRAHVWSPEGKLVTSIRYTPESIERKKNADIWRPASADEVGELRRAVARHGS